MRLGLGECFQTFQTNLIPSPSWTHRTLTMKVLHAFETSVSTDLAIWCHISEDLNLQHWHYLLTPWCRVLLEKLTGSQLVKKFPAFHGTRKSITALTSVCHLSLSWASPMKSIYPHPTSWRSFLILSTHLGIGLPSGLFSSGFPSKTVYTPLSSIHTRHMPNASHSYRFYHPHSIG